MSEMLPQEVEQMVEGAQAVMLAYAGFMETVALYANIGRALPALSPDGISLTLQ
jgi:hypothetical protein